MPRQSTINIHTILNDNGITDQHLLEHILYNVLSGTESEKLIKKCVKEYMPEILDEDNNINFNTKL